MRLLKELREQYETPFAEQAPALIYEGEVCGTKRYDLKYIYHHVYVGAEAEVMIEDTETAAVYFKSFKIGCIPGRHRRTLCELIARGYSLKCVITGFKKKKFLPVESITLKITER